MVRSGFCIKNIAYGKSKTEKVKGTRDEYHRVANDDFLLADGIHESIIDLDLWESAQEIRRETGVKWNKTHSLEHDIESIELHPERLEDGRIVKQINFMFPVFYKGVESMAIRLPNEKTVESIVLLGKSNRKRASNEPKSELAQDLGECRGTARSLQSFGRKPDTHVRFSLDMEDYYRIKDQEK